MGVENKGQVIPGHLVWFIKSDHDSSLYSPSQLQSPTTLRLVWSHGLSRYPNPLSPSLLSLSSQQHYSLLPNPPKSSHLLKVITDSPEMLSECSWFYKNIPQRSGVSLSGVCVLEFSSSWLTS